MNRAFIFAAAVSSVLVAGCGTHVREDVPFRAALGARLATPPAYALDDAEAWAAVQSAYRISGARLLWLGDDAPRGQVERLRAALAHATSDGLEPARYPLPPADAPAVERRGIFGVGPRDPIAVADADVAMSFAAARLVRDLHRGIAVTPPADETWRDDTQADYGALVQRAAGTPRVEDVLRSLAPREAQYARLRDALGRYRALEAAGGWTKLPPMPAKPKAGMKGPEVVALRARLATAGEAFDGATGDSLDPALQDALKRFQRAHGLAESGLPDAPTIAALDVPAAERARQIELNLERLRWLPEELPDPRIEVNVPTFELTAYEHGQPALEMRVVTGRTDTPTPIFSGSMQTVVFSPYWNVPGSILKKEIIPELAKDADYLARKNMEVVRGGEPVDPSEVDLDDAGVRVRQKPGTGNALGHVKFLFPNPYDVYLHDTPTRLFARNARSFSHGCVRIEKPYELAQWVLGANPEWTAEKIAAAMDSGAEQHVALKRKVPVFILYQTVRVDDDGTVRFAKDVYGHDLRHEKLLEAAAEAGGGGARVAAR